MYLQASSGGGAWLENCTFHSNAVVRGYGGAVYSAGAPVYVTNSIFWGNAATPDSGPTVGRQVYSQGGTVSISYACFPGTTTNEVYAGGTLTIDHIITADPQFVDAAGHDLHLKARFGHWTSGGWVNDTVTSPCIDAGDPASPYDREPFYNGNRINLGAYGNTVQASRSDADPAIDNAGGATYVPGQTTATLNGTLTSTGAAPAEVWVYWGPVDGSTNETGAWAFTNAFGINVAALPVALATNVDVTPDTTYYYRYRAANAYGTNWASPSAMFATAMTAPEVTVQATDPDAAEDGNDPGVFTFYRTDVQTSLPLTVYYTVGGSASNGVDYSTIASSVTIPAGGLSATVTVAPLYDALGEGSETVVLTLQSSLLYTVGSPGSATVTIADNATAGSLIYVDRDVAGGAHDGSSWTNACGSFSAAVARVASGGVIWVARGIYTNTAEIVVATPDVTIYGGFTNGMRYFSQRDPVANAVTVDGNYAWRCFSVTASNVTLDGLTLRRGRVAGNGGGINNSAANLVLNGCTVVNCGATGDNTGGGIYSSQPLQVLNSFFGANTNSLNANGKGGGAIAFDSTGALLVSNTAFRGNTANDTSAGDATSYGAGGAIEMVQAGRLTAANCVFDGNASLHNEVGKNRRGGAIYLRSNSGGGAWLTSCTFYGNYVVRGFGGAIYSAGSPLYITNSILWGNTSTANDGSIAGQQIYSESGPVSIGYACLPGTTTNDVFAGGTLAISGVITNDPLFADAAAHDLHLKSSAGRWTPGGWVTDRETLSPCIDAGDPGSPYGNEPEPNGRRINLGAEGNTVYASMTQVPGTVLIIN